MSRSTLPRLEPVDLRAIGPDKVPYLRDRRGENFGKI